MAQQSNTPMLLPKKAQDGLIAFHTQCYSLLNQQWNIREQMRQIDLTYIREKDWTSENMRARIANAYGDADRLQNITVPVVMPQVEDAVAYQTAVFLQGTPIFGVVAEPAYEDQALQMNTIMEENSIRGGWARHLMMYFRDAFKYNLALLEVVWDREVTAALETDISFGPDGKPKEVIWEGNCLRRWDPYNSFFDTRVCATDIPTRGEFVGTTMLMGRVDLKKFINTLPDKMVENIIPAFNSGLGGMAGGTSTGGIQSYFIPQINPQALINKNARASTDWMAWAGITGAADGKILYKNMYEVTIMYARIIPADFDLRVPSRNTPQIWKLIVVNHQVIIYAERQTNAHDKLPVFFLQPYEDGLWYQTKSLATNVQPIQDVSSALMNSVIAARRRAISDRVLYDPSRINEAQINSPNPSAKIPVRPSAYGKNIAESVYAFPFRDDQSAMAMSAIEQLDSMGNRISGRNKAQQGQFVKGNKTLHEYADIMAHANGRDQMVALNIEYQVLTPVKEVLKFNILQYQQGASYFSRSQNKTVKIDPVSLRNAVLTYKVSDGLIPSDKLISADILSVALQQIGTSPQIGAGYNVAQLFSYLMKTQGAHLQDFEKSPEQLAYEQAMNQWSQLSGAIAQVLTKAASNWEQLQQVQELLKNLPPQPKPEDFGYNPNPTPQATPQQAS